MTPHLTPTDAAVDPARDPRDEGRLAALVARATALEHDMTTPGPGLAGSQVARCRACHLAVYVFRGALQCDAGLRRRCRSAPTPTFITI